MKLINENLSFPPANVKLKLACNLVDEMQRKKVLYLSYLKMSIFFFHISKKNSFYFI